MPLTMMVRLAVDLVATQVSLMAVMTQTEMMVILVGHMVAQSHLCMRMTGLLNKNETEQLY